MNKLLHIVFVSALLAVIYSEVTARSYARRLSRVHKSPLGIINGTSAAEGEFPYMVQLLDSSKSYFCGGAIIGVKWIITAGECLDAQLLDSIVYGTNILNQSGETSNVIKVKESYLHPKFFYDMTDVGAIPLYDVGVIELEEPIPFSDKAQPVKLPAFDEIAPIGVDGVLSGWGSNDTTSGFPAPNLQKVVSKLLNDSECARIIDDYLDSDMFNPVHNLCSDNIGNGECYSDFGSPYVINGTQYGIVTWFLVPCGSNPGTYSRLTNPEYLDFIRNVTGI